MTAPTPGTRADSDGLAEALVVCLGSDDGTHYYDAPGSVRAQVERHYLPVIRAWHDAQVADLTARAETAARDQEAQLAVLRRACDNWRARAEDAGARLAAVEAAIDGRGDHDYLRIDRLRAALNDKAAP